MGFQENLKLHLKYSGLLIKELAARSGVKKKTIESYLGNRGYTPSVENAYKIARALDVSVEYLLTGDESKERPLSSLPNDIQAIVLVSEHLSMKDRQVILSLAQTLKKHTISPRCPSP